MYGLGVGHWIGWVKDKLGKPVNQAVFVLKVNPQGTLYQVVCKRFFRDEERFVTPRKGRSCVTLVKNTLIREKARNIQYVDVETGESKRFDGNNFVSLRPDELDAILTSEDVKQASSGGGMYDGMALLMVGVVGAVLGALFVLAFYSNIMNLIGGM